jgi:diguanylate cyclase (GGDEF)-like protein
MAIILLPIGSYSVYRIFQNIEKDAFTLIQLHKNHGKILESIQIQKDSLRTQRFKEIDQNFLQLDGWFKANKKNIYYVGASNPYSDFHKMLKNWQTIQKKWGTSSYHVALKNYIRSMHMLLFNIKHIVLLNKTKVYNLLYLITVVMMIVFILLILGVRSYIAYQLRKNAIHDFDTKLFNKKYFLSELSKSCARSARNKSPLSMLSISIINFNEQMQKCDKKTKSHILELFGETILSLTRTSDTACRHDDKYFCIMLPDTKEENAAILQQRLQSALQKCDFGIDTPIEFTFAISQFDYNETAEAYMKRVESMLK